MGRLARAPDRATPAIFNGDSGAYTPYWLAKIDVNVNQSANGREPAARAITRHARLGPRLGDAYKIVKKDHRYEAVGALRDEAKAALVKLPSMVARECTAGVGSLVTQATASVLEPAGLAH